MTRSRQTADWGSRAGFSKLIPTSVAVGSGTGSANSLGTVTFSGVSSVSLNTIFSSTYDNYTIYISNLIASSGTPNFYIRLRTSGTDNSSASYAIDYYERYDTGFSTGQNLNTTAFDFGNAATTKSFVDIKLSDVFKAEFTGILIHQVKKYANGTSLTHAIAGGTHAVNTSYDGFTLYPSANTLSGVISVYGHN